MSSQGNSSPRITLLAYLENKSTKKYSVGYLAISWFCLACSTLVYCTVILHTGSIIHTVNSGNSRSIPNHRIYFCSDLPPTLQGPNYLVLSGNFSGASFFTATKPLYLFSAAPHCSEVSSSFSVNPIPIKMSKIYIGFVLHFHHYIGIELINCEVTSPGAPATTSSPMLSLSTARLLTTYVKSQPLPRLILTPA